VFDGQRGGYREDDRRTQSTCGRSKALGEVGAPGCVTVRTSIIGRELTGTSGLVRWFLSRRKGTADGFARAVFSGFTTTALSGILLRILTDHAQLQNVSCCGGPHRQAHTPAPAE
jgi:dTDP-4-dehydrorhamnose reductase